MNAPFVWGANGEIITPDQVRKKRVAEAMIERGTDTSPVQHWTQGAARVAQALAGRYREDQIDEEAKTQGNEAWDASTSGIKSILGGSASASAPQASPSSAAPMAQSDGKGGEVFGQIGPRLHGDLMKDFGLSPDQAAGVVGNLAHESGGFGTLQETAPAVPGSRGGFGYAQWTGPRRQQFEEWSGTNKLDPASYEANYGFLAHELKNTPEGRVLEDLRKAPDAASATQLFSDKFLRPGVPGMDSRQKWAQRAQAFGAPPAGEPPAQPMQVASADPNFVPQSPAAMQAQAAPQATNLTPAQTVAQAMPAPPAPALSPERQRVAQAMPQAAAPAMSGMSPERQQVFDALVQKGRDNPSARPYIAQQLETLKEQAKLEQAHAYDQAKTAEQRAYDERMKREGWSREDSRFSQTHGLDREKFDREANKPMMLAPGATVYDPSQGKAVFTAANKDETDKSSAELRKEIHGLPSYKNYSQAVPIYRSMVETAGRDTKASDLNLVYGLGKIFDPTSVVREGEQIMVRNTAGLPEWLVGQINALNGGAALSAETRDAIMTEAYGRMKGYNDQFGQDTAQYRGIVDRRKMNAEDVIPNFGEITPYARPKPTTAQPGQAAPISAPAPQPAAPQDAPAQIKSPEEFQSLASGSIFIAPDGTTRRKP